LARVKKVSNRYRHALCSQWSNSYVQPPFQDTVLDSARELNRHRRQQPSDDQRTDDPNFQFLSFDAVNDLIGLNGWNDWNRSGQ